MNNLLPRGLGRTSTIFAIAILVMLLIPMSAFAQEDDLDRTPVAPSTLQAETTEEAPIVQLGHYVAESATEEDLAYLAQYPQDVQGAYEIAGALDLIFTLSNPGQPEAQIAAEFSNWVNFENASSGYGYLSGSSTLPEGFPVNVISCLRIEVFTNTTGGEIMRAGFSHASDAGGAEVYGESFKVMNGSDWSISVENFMGVTPNILGRYMDPEIITHLGFDLTGYNLRTVMVGRVLAGLNRDDCGDPSVIIDTEYRIFTGSDPDSAIQYILDNDALGEYMPEFRFLIFANGGFGTYIQAGEPRSTYMPQLALCEIYSLISHLRYDDDSSVAVDLFGFNSLVFLEAWGCYREIDGLNVWLHVGEIMDGLTLEEVTVMVDPNGDLSRNQVSAYIDRFGFEWEEDDETAMNAWLVPGLVRFVFALII